MECNGIKKCIENLCMDKASRFPLRVGFVSCVAIRPFDPSTALRVTKYTKQKTPTFPLGFLIKLSGNCYQIFTRCSGAKYNESPGFTLNAS